jgi:4'-phosphopantetheinyl transferase
MVRTTLEASSCVKVFLIEGIRCRRKAVSTVLSRYLACRPDDLALSISPFGKWNQLRPSSEFRIEFSVTYSERRCLIAVSSGGDVGIDVERRRSIGDIDGIASIYFTPAEAAKISALQDDQKLEAFFACWTFKEAYTKAIGSGLLMPFDMFGLPATSWGASRATCAAIQGREWTHLRFEPWPGYTATLVVAGRLPSSAFHFTDDYASDCL